MNNDEYRIQEPKRVKRNGFVLLTGLIFLSALIAVVYYTTKVNSAATSDSRAVSYKIERGTSTRQIATDLENKNIINSKNVFLVYSWLHGASSKFQAGSYALDSHMTIAEIIDVLTQGKVVSSERKITVVEGRTNSQIAAYLVDRGVVKTSPDFLKILSDGKFDFKFNDAAEKFNYQGFLFPDTYTLSPEQTAGDLTSKMLNNFESKITDKMLSDITSKKRTLSEVIILASIIEKEVGRNKETLTADDLQTMQQERRNVASVFYNRLEINMPLESDATVNYVTGKSTRSISLDDTKLKSPYNTYVNRGLPPTPISNPGLDSIMAAIYPADTNYVYFLNSPDGTAYFATTLEQHNANKAKYLK